MEQKLTLLNDVSKYTKSDVLEEIKECVKLLEAIGYPAGTLNHYVVRPTTQSIKKLGSCKRIGNKQFRITVNSHFIKYGKARDVHQMIMHEVIHSLPGCMNHGEKWQEVAAEVNTIYDFAPITRITHAPEYWNTYAKKQYKHQVTCLLCGRSWKWVKYSTKVKGCIKGTCTCPCGSKQFEYKYIGE